MVNECLSFKTYTIAETARQYLSHILRNRGWPPRSHSFIVTLPLVTFLILNPTYRQQRCVHEILHSNRQTTIATYQKVQISCWQVNSLVKYEAEDSPQKSTHCWDHIFTISTSLRVSTRNKKLSHQHDNQKRQEKNT